MFLLGASAVLPGVADLATLTSLVRESPENQAEIDPRSARVEGLHAALPTGRMPAGPPPRSLAGVDLRGFDPLSRLLTSATAECLRDAQIALRGPLRDRAGLFAALRRISPASAHELDDSVKERGLLRLSAPAFTRVVLNASTGAAARSLQLRGPTTTITTGDGGGLAALVLACDHLSLRDDADLICAASADEIDPDEDPSKLCEASACVALGSGAIARSSNVRVIGWAFSGPGDREGAIARALAMAGIPRTDAPPPAPLPAIAAPAAFALLGAAIALHRLRAGDGTTLLLAHDSASVATAAVFQRIDS